MATVMIGVDTHKGSHTAVAIDAPETPLGELRVRATAAQAGKLLEWAAEWPERTWAVEGAGGLGHVLAQQLLAAGEQVLDVQPKLGARVRLASSGTSNKNDPNDTRSVAVAVRASGTTLTEVFGVGPVIAAAVIGDVADISRSPSADRFASYNGTAPIEVSSGSRKIYRLSMRGNPAPQPCHSHGRRDPDRAQAQRWSRLLQRKLAEGKTPSEARRALKRKISNAIYARLQADAHRAATPAERAREGNGGTTLHPARPAHTPRAPGSSGKPLPSPPPPYVRPHGPAPRNHSTTSPRVT